MKTNIHKICATLFVSAAFIAKSAYSETNNVANRIDFSGFYREWAVSPSNALAQIKPPLMDLAASAKTNAADHALLYNALLHLVSTNVIVISNTNFLSAKRGLIVDVFKTSGTFSSPQEDEIMPIAKTLALIAKSHQINAIRRRENFVLKISDEDTTRKYWESINLQNELNSAFIRIRNEMTKAMMEMENAPQPIRDRLFSEIISLRILTQNEASKIAEHWGITTPFQVLPNQPD